MSELTQCNYCSLKAIRKKAEASGKKVTILQDAVWGLGGSNVYLHPSNINIYDLGDEEKHAKYRIAWMQEIGYQCSC